MSLPSRLATALTSALRTRDAEEVSALRGAIAAISNAEAVTSPQRNATEVVLGVGPSEVPRRELTDEEIVAIVREEITERRSAAAVLERHGHDERAARLVREAGVLEKHLQD